jgi:hypothetical protein
MSGTTRGPRTRTFERRLWDHDTGGASFVEYLILVAAVALFSIGAARLFGHRLRAKAVDQAGCVSALSGCDPGSAASDALDGPITGAAPSPDEKGGEPRVAGAGSLSAAASVSRPTTARFRYKEDPSVPKLLYYAAVAALMDGDLDRSTGGTHVDLPDPQETQLAESIWQEARAGNTRVLPALDDAEVASRVLRFEPESFAREYPESAKLARGLSKKQIARVEHFFVAARQARLSTRPVVNVISAVWDLGVSPTKNSIRYTVLALRNPKASMGLDGYKRIVQSDYIEFRDYDLAGSRFGASAR